LAFKDIGTASEVAVDDAGDVYVLDDGDFRVLELVVG
jgi:hypothetical protein